MELYQIIIAVYVTPIIIVLITMFIDWMFISTEDPGYDDTLFWMITLWPLIVTAVILNAPLAFILIKCSDYRERRIEREKNAVRNADHKDDGHS